MYKYVDILEVNILWKGSNCPPYIPVDLRYYLQHNVIWSVPQSKNDHV